MLSVYVLLLTVLLNNSESARILGIVPTGSYSHQIPFRPIWKELSLRGHDVVVATTDPVNDPQLVNLTELNMHFIYNDASLVQIKDLVNGKISILKILDIMARLYPDVIAKHLEHPNMQNLIHNETEHFDVVMVEHIAPIMFAFARRFKCPLIAISSLGLSQEGYLSIGAGAHPGTHPSYMMPFYTDLTYFERIVSTVWDVFIYAHNVKSEHFSDKVIHKYFGADYPTVGELKTSVDMVFANTNPVLSIPRAMPPALIEFGCGMQMMEPKALPKDLQDFLDGTKEVIYFSLGSNVKSVLLPESLRKVFLETFSELPYKVLWKFEDDNFLILLKAFNPTPYIKIMKWMPQQDILRHPNVKVFITQCGFQSMEEALYTNVPLVGLPFFGDQLYNGKMIEKIGIGVNLEKDTLTKAIFKNAILDVMQNPKYKNKIVELAKLSKDQPMSGLEKVIWWTEYVIRHKGAKHLRSPQADQPFYQFYHLDVIGGIAITLALILFVIYKTCICCCLYVHVYVLIVILCIIGQYAYIYILVS